MILVIKKTAKKKALKAVGTLAMFILKPFMPLIIFLTILLVLIGFFVDIFNWKIENEDEETIKAELAYYKVEEAFNDIKEFVESAWDFVTGSSGDLKWPVKGYKTITSDYGYRTAPTSRSILFSWRHRYWCTRGNKTNRFNRRNSYKS